MGSVRLGNDHGIPVHANPVGAEPQAVDFRPQDVQVHQAAGWNEKPGLRPHEACRELAHQDQFSSFVLEGVPGIGPAAANAKVDLLLERNNRGNLTFAFGTELAAHHDPNAHVCSSAPHAVSHASN